MQSIPSVIIWLMFSLLAPVIAAAETVWYAQPGDSVLHAPSGAAFPRQSAGLTRLAPTLMGTTQELIAVSYVGPGTGNLDRAEVMLARTLADPLDAVLAEARQRSARLPSAHAGPPAAFVLDSASGPVNGHRLRIAYLDADRRKRLQEIVIVAAGSWLGRITADYEEAAADAVEARLTDLIVDIYWPLD